MIYSKMKELHILGNELEKIEKSGIVPVGLKKSDIKKLNKIFITLFFESKIYLSEKRIIKYLVNTCKLRSENNRIATKIYIIK
jgi:hypothetical protein